MEILYNESFFRNCMERYNALPLINAESIEKKKTVFVMVDIINGFIREGALHDREIEKIIFPTAEFLRYCNKNEIKSIAFADSHTKASAEFSHFPPHCISGSRECMIVDELTDIGGFELIEKNSVNGFYAPKFKRFLENNPDKSCYIVCGDCTDICVLNFCLSLKSYFDQYNKKVKIIVPVNMVETYNSNSHIRENSNIMALYIMETNGIKLAGGIKYR